MLMLRVLPAPAMRVMAFPISFFYWIFSISARRASAAFFRALGLRPRTLAHVASFALNLVENVQAWAGRIGFERISWRDDDVLRLVADIDAGRGTLLVISHLGNAQMLKALATLGKSGTGRRMSITTVMDEAQSAGFNAMLSRVNGGSSFRIVSANDIGPDTAVLLQERLSSGECVVIAGDRVGAHSSRRLRLPFLGRNADFPYGVFLLAALMDVPTYFVSGIRVGDLSPSARYEMRVRRSSVSFGCPRREREGRIRALAAEYAENLAALARERPLQWYNFYDFFAD